MKKLSFGFHQVVGRSKGKITSYQRGGGHQKRYRFVDFFRFLHGVEGKVLNIIHDPYRTSNLALIGYTNGLVSYMLAIDGIKVGDHYKTVITFKNTDFTQKGFTCRLGNVKVGLIVHNLEILPLNGGQLARSAGTGILLLKKYKDEGLVKLPSGKLMLVSLDCLCTIGNVSNIDHKLKSLKKAGRSRWLGIRPHVRGRAMNPVDHPHGGRTNGGIIPKTPWGRLAKGVPTRKKNKKSI